MLAAACVPSHSAAHALICTPQDTAAPHAHHHPEHEHYTKTVVPLTLLLERDLGALLPARLHCDLQDLAAAASPRLRSDVTHARTCSQGDPARAQPARSRATPSQQAGCVPARARTSQALLVRFDSCCTHAWTADLNCLRCWEGHACVWPLGCEGSAALHPGWWSYWHHGVAADAAGRHIHITAAPSRRCGATASAARESQFKSPATQSQARRVSPQPHLPADLHLLGAPRVQLI